MEYFLNTKASGERIGKICGRKLMIEHACTITEIKELLMILCHIFCSGFSSYWLPANVSQTTKMHVAGVREENASCMPKSEPDRFLAYLWSFRILEPASNGVNDSTGIERGFVPANKPRSSFPVRSSIIVTLE